MSDITIKEAKKQLRDNWEKGSDCPCCTQFVKLYKRTLQSTMAVMLISLYKLTKRTGKQYHHVLEMMKGYEISGTGDFASSRFWGLTEEAMASDNLALKRQGFWRLTDKGKEFVENKINMPVHIKVFNAHCYGFSDKMISIEGALKKKFNYWDLMRG